MVNTYYEESNPKVSLNALCIHFGLGNFIVGVQFKQCTVSIPGASEQRETTFCSGKLCVCVSF